MSDIKNKPKLCRGTGKAKNNGCGTVTVFRKYGLCRACYSTWLLTTPNGRETLLKARIIGKKRVIKQKAKETREKKEANKSIQKLIQEARVHFHRWIRFRDANNPCISCRESMSSIWDAGHFYKAELYSGLIFDERNCHKQCRKCNSFLGGNESLYRQNLTEIFGETWMEILDRDAQSSRMRKWTREELNGIKQYYINKLKQSKNEN